MNYISNTQLGTKYSRRLLDMSYLDSRFSSLKNTDGYFSLIDVNSKFPIDITLWLLRASTTVEEIEQRLPQGFMAGKASLCFMCDLAIEMLKPFSRDTNSSAAISELSMIRNSIMQSTFVAPGHKVQIHAQEALQADEPMKKQALLLAGQISILNYVFSGNGIEKYSPLDNCNLSEHARIASSLACYNAELSSVCVTEEVQKTILVNILNR